VSMGMANSGITKSNAHPERTSGDWSRFASAAEVPAWVGPWWQSGTRGLGRLT